MLSRLGDHLLEIVRGASITVVVKGVGALAEFGLSVAVARALGVESSGVFFLSLTMVTVLSRVSALGFDQGALRLISTRPESDRTPFSDRVYRISVLFAAGGAAILAVLLGATAGLYVEPVFGEPRLAFALPVMLAAVPAVTATLVQGQALTGLKRIFAAQVVRAFVLPGAALGLFLAVGRGFGLTGAAAAYVTAAWLAATAGHVVWGMVEEAPARENGEEIGPAEVRKSVRVLFQIRVVDLAVKWSPSLILGALGTTYAVGLYEAAFRTTMAMGLVLAGVNSIAAPKYGELIGEGEMETLAALSRDTARLCILAGLPVLAVIVLWPELVMSLFGEGFTAGRTVLVVTAVGQFVNVATGSVGYLLIMAHEELYYLISLAAALVVGVALCALLVPAHGALGAAIGAATGIALSNLLAVVFVRSRLGFNPFPVRVWQYEGESP